MTRTFTFTRPHDMDRQLCVCDDDVAGLFQKPSAANYTFLRHRPLSHWKRSKLELVSLWAVSTTPIQLVELIYKLSNYMSKIRQQSVECNNC